MKTQPMGPFLGINNRLPEFSLQTDTGAWMHDAENVEVDNAGRLRRRAGLTLIHAVSGAHSLYLLGPNAALLVRDQSLYRITLMPYAEVLLKSLASNEAMSYAEQGGCVFFSNGTDAGQVAANGAVYPLGMATPTAPTLAAIAGTLAPGKYQVGVTYLNATTGEESGHAGTTTIELAATGGIRVTLPAATAGATHVLVYLSQQNGSLAYHRATIASGTASTDISSLGTLGRQMREAYEQPMPAGTGLFIHRGRLCCIVGQYLYYSSPYRPGYGLATGYLWFASAIGTAIANDGGVYVAADVTRFFAGDIENPQAITVVLPYGAVLGTTFRLAHKTTVGWFGEKGFVLADTQGQVQAIMVDNVDLVAPSSGLAVLIDDAGFRRVLACGWCLNINSAAVTRYTGMDLTSASGNYATRSDGLFRIGGTDDAGVPITASAHLGKIDFGADTLKGLPAAYVGCSSSEPLLLRVETPNGSEYDYTARSRSDEIKIHRIDPGKGLRETWYGLSLHNIDGSDFTLASVSFAPALYVRKV